jgi:hypothetical protein
MAGEEGPPWRRVTVPADGEDARKLAWEHQDQFGHRKYREIEIYWRTEENGDYTFILSPAAAINASERLTGVHLHKIARQEASKLLAEGFKRTDPVGR